jgi:uncharacterized membrane protein YgaE (UPF0421/DUF939 family)
LLVEELESKTEELNMVKKHLEEVEKKTKSDIKVLVKEVKSLRSSQAELKKIANQYSEERTALQVSYILCNYRSQVRYLIILTKRMLGIWYLGFFRLLQFFILFSEEVSEIVMSI